MNADYKHLKETVGPGVFTQSQEIAVEIYAFTDLGMKVAINDEYTGLVYRNEIYDEYKKGQTLKAYVKCVRDDGRIDVTLRPYQGMHVRSTAERILDHLKAADGRSTLNDKSSPEDIEAAFQVSKKVFKQAIGSLYKHGKIKMTGAGIELVDRS